MDYLLDPNSEDYSSRRQDILDLVHHQTVIKKVPLHEEQKKLIDFVLGQKCQQGMGQWGRSAGKTECILFLAFLWAKLFPGSRVYIYCPEKKQGKEIYWASGRIQNACPRKWIERLKEIEQRVVLKNKSFVCVEGVDNIDALRGTEPNLAIYDEFQHHRTGFHEEIVRPKMMNGITVCVAIGTPPKSREAYYVKFREELLKRIAEGDTTRFYMEVPNEANPSLNKALLAEERDRLLAMGDYGRVIYLREHRGQLAFGGEGSLFPELGPRHIFPHDMLVTMVQKDLRHMKLICETDPGTTTVHATLLGIINPYTSQVFILDEIYEKNRRETATSRLFPRIKAKQEELAPGLKWQEGYDEAAAMYATEVFDQFQVTLVPTHKKHWELRDRNDIIPGVALIKSLLCFENTFYISDRCVNLYQELQEMQTNEENKLVHTPDHLFDCLRYMLCRANYSVKNKPREHPHDILDKRERYFNYSKRDRDDFNDEVFEHQNKLDSDWFN